MNTEEQLPKPEKPTENVCPHCGSTLIGSNQGNRLTCSNKDCGFTMGFGNFPGEEENKELPAKGEDTITT